MSRSLCCCWLKNHKIVTSERGGATMTSTPLIVAIFMAFTCTSTWTSVLAFNFGGTKAAPASKVPLPTFDEATNRYTKNPLDDGKYPYDAIGAALRHGPSPFLTRVFNADEYEQGVLKYMLTYKCDRAEATGNTDSRLNGSIKRWKRNAVLPKWTTPISIRRKRG